MKLPDLSLACTPLCKQKLKRKLKRPHLSCATCLDRRYHYDKVDRRDYVKLKANQPFALLKCPSPMILPVKSKWYYLIINQNGCRLKLLIKHVFTKMFLTCAELFANW